MENITEEEIKIRLGRFGKDLRKTIFPKHLKILYPLKDKRASNGGFIWHCLCDCGNEVDIDASNLRDRKNKKGQQVCSNYCKFSPMKKDITGQQFGKLIALYPNDKAKGGHTAWHCKCSCGNEIDIDLGNLTQGFSKSCGCTNSQQEENIIKLLKNNSVNFYYQYRFIDLPTKEFDFYIENKYIVEFDGSQHFQYTGTGWDTKEHFERTRKSDLLKNKYCFDHNIPLIRIPYNAEYNINDLKLETTRFLLTLENEREYYEKTAEN